MLITSCRANPPATRPIEYCSTRLFSVAATIIAMADSVSRTAKIADPKPNTDVGGVLIFAAVITAAATTPTILNGTGTVGALSRTHSSLTGL